MKTMTIIGGVDGVGKSSLMGVLDDERSDLGTIIDVDKLTAQSGGDRIRGGKIALNVMNDCLNTGKSFTWETTLSGNMPLKTVNRARENGYTVRLYYVALDNAEKSIARIKNRVAEGGHDIPQKDVLRRFERRFSSLEKIVGLCDEVKFYDNNNGFKVVGIYRNGRIIPTVKNPPKWLDEIAKPLDKH
jgi:predicted ABC-type ATPase